MDNTQLSFIITSLQEIKEDIKNIKKLLNGNGSIGLLEAHRDLEQKFLNTSVRIRSIEEKIEPICENFKKRNIVLSFIKQVVLIIITVSPMVIPAFIWMIKIWNKLNEIVPINSVVGK